MILNKFKTKEVKTTITVGERLKKRREELGLSVEEISVRLGTKTAFMEDLEISNYSELPPDVYVRGFIKNYSEIVGLDPEKMAKLFRREKEVEEKIGDKNEKRNKSKKKEKLAIRKYIIITPGIITVFLSLLALSFVGYYFWYQLSSFNSEPYLFVSSPSSDEITSKAEMVVSGETEIGMVIMINGENTTVDENGRFEESIMLQPGKNVIIIEAVNRFNKTKKEKRSIIYEKKLKPMPIENE